eukprot:Em0001g2067a
MLGVAPDGFDAVSVQNVGSTYIIVSRDLPTHSNGILINFSLYCNGALVGVLPLTVISYNTTGLLFTLYMYMYVFSTTANNSVHGPPVTPTDTAPQLECGVGRHQCCSQPAQHEDSPPGGPPDPELDTNVIVISLFINKIINPDKSFGSSSALWRSLQPLQLEQDVGLGSAEQDALTMKESPLKNLILFFLKPHPSWGWLQND